ncbi:MBG domain-containing protein [Geobacter pickeringii]|uniref:MBG domain-containing protein n=1 Tax=Geobacter pickeringii TaxID=345632 RepID=UPI00068C4597|nr:MBG domain-containing protein [Geobacter pickeringii]
MDCAQKIKWMLVALCLLLVAVFVPTAQAADWTLSSVNSTVTLNDSSLAGSSPGVYSWVFDNAERISQQAFYYRVGTTSPEVKVSGDALDAAAPFTVVASNQTASSVTLTFTEKAGRFTMAVTYGLMGGTTGRSTLTKKVVITNLTAAPLDLHLFSYSDYDLKTGAYLFENATIVNGRAYQSSFATATDAIGAGTTLVERATVPPSRYGVDNAQFKPNLANGTTPYNLDNFAGPYTVAGGAFDNGDKQFALQWDLTIAPTTPTSFTITDDFYPTKSPYLAKGTVGTCVNYGQNFTNTYTFDNTRNSVTTLDNLQISEKLASNISLASATNGGAYDAVTGTVNWSIPQLAAGAVQQTVQGTYLVNSVADFSMTSQLGSDEAFPSSISAKLVLCNHPPVITSFPGKNGTEGQPYSYQVTAVDPDAGTKLTYFLDVAPAGMTISSTGLIAWTPASNQTGNNTVTIRVSDGSLSTTQTYNLFIAYVNVAPVITSSPVTSAYVGVSYPYTATATDANLAQGDKIVFGLPVAPAGMVINPTTGAISWIPTAAQVGPQNVVVQVTDLLGLFAQQSFTVTVSQASSLPPTMNAITPSTVNAGAAFSYQVVASDPQAQTLTYSLAGNPAGMTVSSTGLISWAATVAGTYNVTVTATNTSNLSASQTLTLTANKQTPTITWAAPTAITYGTALSATQLNATASVAGSFTYTPAVGTMLNAGTQTLSVIFTPTDAANYNATNANVTLTVNAAAATVTLGGLSATYDGTAKSVTATTTPAGKTVTVTYNGSATAPTAAGSYVVVATVTDANYTGSATGTLVIAKATPSITWGTPSAVVVGTALSATQLNATASVPGTYTYTPASGAVMNTAGPQTLSVSFAPTDSTNYSSASATVSLTVNNKQTPTITWAAPTAITYGTALSATQLNATASVAGSFTYTPAVGTMLNAGTQTLSVIFTPTDTANYNATNANVTLTVNAAVATVTLGGLSATYDGTAKSATATTNPAGKSVSITYNGSSTAPTAAGSYPVVATVTDANYTGSATGTLVIAKGTPTITWGTPSAVVVGTALSATQLNATASVPGTYTYTPASGAVMNTAGPQTLSVSFAPTDSTNYSSASATVSLTVNNKQTPTITWAAPTAITYGTALSATQLNATASVAGSFTYTPAAGTVLNAGTQTLSVTFTPTDTATYSSTSATVSLVVNKAAATVTLGGLSATYDGTAKSATAATNPAGKSVSITYNGSSTTPTAAGSYPVVASVSDPNYTGSATGTLVIAKATPSITWGTPSAVVVGTALSATQLNATASVPGTYTYTPASGAVMNTAGPQTLSVSFAPTDSTNYSSASATVSLTVNNKQTPTITWAAPTAITYGTALSATQLNATASVAGSFAYTPAAGTVLNAGTQTLSVTFTPTDTATYSSTSATVSLVVNKAAATVTLGGLSATYDGTAKSATAATNPAGKSVSITYNGSSTAPTAAGSYPVVASVSDPNYTGSATGTLVIAKATPSITWGTPSAVVVGTALSATQLNATASVPGTYTYTPASGAVMNTAGPQTLSVSFAPTDSTNYSSASATVSLTVNNKQTPTITWAAPTAITYGTALSATQLNATASVPGTFVYTPAVGASLNAGPQTLSVSFTPTDAANYNTTSANVTLTVNPAAATVTLGGLSATYDGTAKSVTATTNPAGKSVSITYNGSSTAPTAAGSYPVVATVTDANYTGSVTGTLVIAKGTPTITWGTPSPIIVGTALSTAQLNATASVPGTYTYTPASGAVMNTAGLQTLSVSFAPTDSANYTTASATVSLTVNNKQTPTITWAAPAAITYGTSLTATQLAATASVPGTFVYTPAVGAIPSVAGTFTYTPAAGTVLNAGTQTLSVTFTPTDTTTYNSATASVTLTVNKATPTITWATPSPVIVGTVLSATQLNATASVGGTYTYTPASGAVMNTAGTQTLIVSFAPTDSTNYSGASATVSLTVNAASNLAPSMTAIPAATITAPTAFSYQVMASDPENQPLSYTLSGNPPGMTVNSTGLISWPTSVAGTYTVTVTATDPGALTASQTFTLTVNSAAANQAPVITSVPVTIGYEEGYYYYQVKASDPGGNSLSYSLIMKPSGMVINPTSGLIYWRPTRTETYPVTVKVTNSAGLSATQSYNLVITERSSNSNNAPMITSNPVTIAVKDQTYRYDVEAVASNGGVITYSLTSSPDGMSINSTTGLITWTPRNSGKYQVTVRARDSKGLSAYQTFTITVVESLTAVQLSVGGNAAGASPAGACDVNGDGVVTVDDINLILAGRGSKNPVLDIDRDGVVTLLDARVCISRLR